MLQFENNHTTKIIAKIERPEAIENIDKIIEATDGIMVARGDLGVEVPLEKVPIMQKMIVNKCISAAKPVIIATQMMESMMINPSPTRAEVTDVANAILDGADALMLSGETATGIHPVRVIDTFRLIINEVEKNGDIYSKYDKGHRPNPKSPTFLSDHICYSACRISDDIEAKAITGMTVSGYTAFMLSCFRPKSDIFIFTTNDHYLNSFSLIWGVRAFHYTSFTTTDDTMNDIQQILREKGFLKSGDRMVITASMPLVEQGRTNTIKISVVD
jgi:pyruvate kinase